MKIKWQAKDIKGGERVTKPGTSETWILGYTPTKDDRPGNDLAMVSLADGCITLTKSPEKMAKELTEEGYVPVEIAETKYFKPKGQR